MKNLLFDDLRQWRVCMKSGIKEFLWGAKTILMGILFGLLSVFRWIGRLIAAFCRREKVAASIISVLLVVLSFGWLSTFLQARTRLTTTEYQRDSIAYVLDKYIQCYDSVIVDGDTIK